MKIHFNQPEQKSADNDHGVRIQYGEAKRPGKPWRWYLILLLASSPLIYLFGLVLSEIFLIKASGRIDVPLVSVRSSSGGFVQQLYVQPLQKVTEGTELALLTNEPLENNYNRLREEIDLLNKSKDTLNKNNSSASSGISQLLHFSRQQRNFYHDRLRQYERLFKQGAATQAEKATARNDYNSALGSLAALENSLRQEQATSSEVRQLDNQISRLTLEFNKTKDEKDQLLLKAPATGLITELFIEPGEYLDRGQRLLDIIFPEKTFITAFIPPKYQDYAVVDQSVTIKFPDGEKVRARIIEIPGITQKPTTDDLGPLETPQSMILAKLQFTEPVENRLVNGLPIDIIFDFFSK